MLKLRKEAATLGAQGPLDEHTGGDGPPPAPGNAQQLHGAQGSCHGTQVSGNNDHDDDQIIPFSIPPEQLTPDTLGLKYSKV